MGKAGLRAVAEHCYHRSHYAALTIEREAGLLINPQAPTKPFFKEFVVELPRPASEVNHLLRDRFGIIGGYDLGKSYPEFDRHMLIAVTEVNNKVKIDELALALRAICEGDVDG